MMNSSQSLANHPLLSRVADAVYWMARYIERAENVARYIGVNLNLQLDLPLDPAHQWQPLIDTTGDTEAFRKHYDWKVLATGPGHGIQLTGGRLLAPVWLSTGTGGHAHRPSGRRSRPQGSHRSVSQDGRPLSETVFRLALGVVLRESRRRGAFGHVGRPGERAGTDTEGADSGDGGSWGRSVHHGHWRR